MAAGARAERFYGRYANPTVTSFEEAVAELEGAEAGLAFASGMGAVATVGAGAVLHAATTSSPSATSTRARSCSCRASAPASGIDVTFVDGTAARDHGRGGPPGPHDAGRGRDAGQPACWP